MSNDINILKDKIFEQRIEYLSDTLSEMAEKTNNSFVAFVKWGGGPEGPQGDPGSQGVPSKPKNPVHVWIKNTHYDEEIPSGSSHEIIGIQEGLLEDISYQEGHCIFLENGHVYVLETIGYNLVPIFKVAMQSYNPGDVVNGKSAYVHFAYANSSDGSEDFITADEIRNNGGGGASTYGLRRTVNTIDESDSKSYAYLGVCSNSNQSAPNKPSMYTWSKVQGVMGMQGIQGPAGPAGPEGPKGDRGDGYTGHPYFIDLEGDMSTINIDIDRTRLYDESNDYCECVLHAYYGNDSWLLPKSDVELDIPKDDNGKDIGKFTLIQDNNDVKIKFVPDEEYVFPTKNLQIPIIVRTEVEDPDNNETYSFERKTIWIIKPIMASFELEIRPSYRVIKIYEDGERFPKNLEVFVYKIEDVTRTLFDLSKESEFTLLWKYQDEDKWNEYKSPIATDKSTCLELQIVRNWDPNLPDSEQDVWDYEDVWTVADGKGTHYFHADLGNAESMLVLTTGEKLPISDDSDFEDIEENYIAELRDPNGYSIVFEPHFYDGSNPLKVIDVDFASSGFDIENLYNGRFKYNFEDITSDEEGSVMQYKFTVTQVPYGVSMIPLSFSVLGEYVELDQNGEPRLDSDGNPIMEEKIDIVSFNVYISEIANTYTLQPSVTSFNTSKGVAYDKDDAEVVCDTIGCSVFKNGQKISSDDDDLAIYNLSLKWFVHQEDGSIADGIYTEPLVFGLDDDIVKDHFQSNDIMIEFVLYYGKKEIVKSTVPLVKDGIDGKDGESWQYIFVRSNSYPFASAQKNDGILNPSEWKIYDDVRGEYISSDPNRADNASEYLGPNGSKWTDDHQGVDERYRYEYQSYRRWDVNKKEWGIYYPPTLYSNYAKDGVDGSGFLTTFSNPVAVIPVGESGYKCEESLDKNVINQKDSTEVYFYNGSQNLSRYQNLEISIDKTSEWSEHFTAERIEDIWTIFFDPVVYNDDDTVKSIFDFGDNGNKFSIGINVIYKISSDIDGDSNDEFYEGLVNWTLTPIKGLEDYEVFVDKRVVNITSDTDTTFRVGYYKISTNGGKKFVEEYNAADGMNIKIHNSVEPTELIDVEYEDGKSWGNCYYDFSDSKRCYVILLDKDDNIIDYTSVEAVTDGKDGYNGYHLELTQDYIALPWNEDKTGVNSKYDDSELTGKPISSKMTLYTDNYKEIKSGITYEVLGLNEDCGYEVIFEEDEDGHRTGKFTIPKEMFDGFVPESDHILTCRAIYQNDIYEKVLFVDLEETPYELELNKGILQRDKDTGKLIDKSIMVKVKYWMDGVWKDTSDGKVVLTCDSIENPLSDNGADEYYERTIYFSDELIQNVDDRDVRISYYKTNESEDIIGEELSYEIIGILDNGKTGSSPYRLDLSNENVTLACDSEGNVYGTGYDENGIDSDSDPSGDIITTTVTLFYGSDIIKLKPEDVSVTYNNEDITSDIIDDVNKDGIIEYTLPATFLNSMKGTNNSINFKVVYNGTPINATMSIGKIKSSYRYYLRPSVSSVVRYEDGSYSVDNGIIKCALWKQDGSKKPVEVTDADIVSSVIGYKFDENSELSPYDYNNGVSISSDCKEIWFEANENGALWDREIVPILKDGKDGTAPSCIGVNILGYSKLKDLPLYEEDDPVKYKEWKPSIDKIGADVGKTVYILQEYIWRPANGEKDYTTRGITSTLAGVQGSNGRILFYLGSFEKDKETLFGENVYGRLTKTVCDYYIDYFGNAWMRTGTEDEEGSDGQEGGKYGNNSSYWEQSQKVGFLQAGAITADMINTGSLVADYGFIDKLKTSELTIDASRVTELDDAIATSTAFAQIKADNEKSLTEFRNTFTTESDVESILTKSTSTIVSLAQEDMATLAMLTDYVLINELGTKLSNAGVITESNAEESLSNMFSKYVLESELGTKLSNAGVVTKTNAAESLANMFSKYVLESELDGKLNTKLSNAGVVTKTNAEESLSNMFSKYVLESELDGKLNTKLSNAGVVTKSNANESLANIFSSYVLEGEIDGILNTKLSNAGVVTKTNAKTALASMFASQEDLDGKVSVAEIITVINDSESEAKIKADKITLAGLKLESENKSLEINLVDGQSYFGKQDETYIQINPDDASIYLQGEGDKWSITSNSYSGLDELVTFYRESKENVVLNKMTNVSSKVTPFMPSEAGYSYFAGSGSKLIENLQTYGTLIKSIGGTVNSFTGLKKGSFKLYQKDTYSGKLSTLNITATPYQTNGTAYSGFFGDLYIVMSYQIAGNIENLNSASTIYKWTKFSLNKTNSTSFVLTDPWSFGDPVNFTGDVTIDGGTIRLITGMSIYYVYEWAAASKPSTPYTQFNITLTHTNDLILDIFDKEGKYEIFRNGFLFRTDYENFCASVSGKSFTAVNGQYGLHIRKKNKNTYDADDGIYILFNGQWLKLDISVRDPNTWEPYDTIDMSKVSFKNVTSNFSY